MVGLPVLEEARERRVDAASHGSGDSTRHGGRDRRSLARRDADGGVQVEAGALRDDRRPVARPDRIPGDDHGGRHADEVAAAEDVDDPDGVDAGRVGRVRPQRS